MGEPNPEKQKVLEEATLVLRSCLPLAERLAAEGVFITLSEAENQQLLTFELITASDFSESDWSFFS